MSIASMGGAKSLDVLESDLPSVAAQAALELDHLLLDRPIGLLATQRLVDVIGNAVTDVNEPASPRSLLNPATAVALSRAIDEALFAGRATTTRLPELIQQAVRFKGRLAAVVRDPSSAAAKEKDELRALCVALSRQAGAVENATRRRRDHPFRKY